MTRGQKLSSALLSVSLSVCRSVCCLFCVVSTLFDCYQTSVLFESVCMYFFFGGGRCVHLSCVSVFLRSQASNGNSRLGTHAHTHTNHFTQNFSISDLIVLCPKDYVCMVAHIRDLVCVCVCVSVHEHTPLHVFSVCLCKKIDLGSVTVEPAGIRGLNGCLSQRNTHTYTHTLFTHVHKHTRTGLRPPLPPGLAVRNTDSGSSLDSDQLCRGFRNAIFTGRLN